MTLQDLINRTERVYSVMRGDIFRVKLGEQNIVGCEQKGDRYCLVVQNDIGNIYSFTTIVVLLTSKQKKELSVHFDLKSSSLRDSVVLCEQIRTIDKFRLGDFVCHISAENMREVDKCLLSSIGISDTLNSIA
jgi:mRNA interferase MazF